MTKHQNITNPATNVKANVPVKVVFNAPVNLTLTYNGGSFSDEPADATPIARNEYKFETKHAAVAEASIENKIMDEIVRRFGCRRESLISIAPFKSCYKMYVVGTTGDVTYLIWVHPDERLIIQRQCW